MSAKIEVAERHVLKAKTSQQRAFRIKEYADRNEQLEIERGRLEAQLCAGRTSSPYHGPLSLLANQHGACATLFEVAHHHQLLTVTPCQIEGNKQSSGTLVLLDWRWQDHPGL